jgi:cysteine-rich repeat protein
MKRATCVLALLVAFAGCYQSNVEGHHDRDTGQEIDIAQPDFYSDNPACGNGILDPGEECDDGNAMNSEGCTALCRNARCGDGLLWSGIEECDDGNTFGGDGCSAVCHLEPGTDTSADAVSDADSLPDIQHDDAALGDGDDVDDSFVDMEDDVDVVPGFVMLSLPDLNLDIREYSDGGTYSALFPGTHTWNGVPFELVLDSYGFTAWHKPGSAPESLAIPVNVFGVTRVYTIINSAWGTIGAMVGSVEFFGSDGSYYSVPLVEGTNIRDHYDGDYVNTIDEITAVPAFNVGSGRARLDMQIYSLPDSFTGEVLTSIHFTSAGRGDETGVPFIVAATVEMPR